MKDNNKTIPEMFYRLQGLDISKFDETFLKKSIKKRITETNCDSEEAYCALLGEQNNSEVEHFLASLFISYSEFFRDPLTFAVLERILLPSIVLKKANAHRKEIRIWSAACASGQETYSLAMLMKEFRNVDGEEINFRIFATDYSVEQVNEAQRGQYSVQALNNLSQKWVNKWFTKEGNSYIVKDELKENIDFSTFDLFNEEHNSPPTSIFGDFDLVVCANLLFYYKPEYRKKILKKVTHNMANGAYLITGEAERNILLQHSFEEVFPQSAIFRENKVDPLYFH